MDPTRNGIDAAAQDAQGLPLHTKILLFLTVLLLATGLLSLPPFTFGYWTRAEPLVVWLHGASAASAGVLALIALRQPETARQALTHPFVLIPAALAVWSLIAALPARFPLLGIFGAPQSGQGALWYVDIAVLTAMMMTMRRNPRAWRWLAVTATAVAAATALCIVLSHRTPALKLLPVADFYAYLALALPFIATPGTQSPFDTRLHLAAWIAAAALVAVSSNLTAAFLLAGIGFATLARAWAASRHDLTVRLSRRSGVLVTLLAMALPYILIRSFPELGAIKSLQSREYLWQIMAAAQSWDPVALLFGHGWGHTQHAFFLFLNASEAPVWQGAWDFLWRDFFHSHNAVLEALYTTGLPGALLTIAMTAAIPWFAPADRRFQATLFAAAYGAMNALWFELAVSLPFYAAAVAGFAALKPAETGTTPRRIKTSTAAVALLSVILLAQAGAAAMLLRFGLAVSTARHAMAAPAANPGTAPGVDFPPGFPTDFRGQDLALALSARHEIEQLKRLKPPVDRDTRARYRAHAAPLLPLLQTRIAGTRTPVLIVSGISLLSAVHYTKELSWLGRTFGDPEKTWRAWLSALLDMAPQRSDTAISYLGWLLQQKRYTDIYRFCLEITERNPKDPVAMFYFGTIMTTRPAEDEKALGLALVGAALANGIDRIMPIPDWLRRKAENRRLPPTAFQTLERAFGR